MDIFEVKGSSGNEYTVNVIPKGDNSVKILCDCKAGIFGRICKHKLAIATGDVSILLRGQDEVRLKDIALKIKERDIGVMLEALYSLRKEHDSIKRKMNKAQKAVELAMKGQP